MKIDIHTKNVALTSAMKEHINTQFQKLEKYSVIKDGTELHVTIETSKENQTNIKGLLDKLNYHTKISADVTTNDFYQAVDMLVHKFDEQIFKFKDKKEDLHKHSTPLKKMFINSEEDINSDEEI